MSIAKVGVGIHNKFVFEVRDAKTNELKQEAVAYNIVLDNMYTRLCNRQAFFTHIQIGTGAGILDPVRTTLFTYSTGKAVVNVELIKDYPVSSRTAKITINPEELVDYTLTEVGIGYAASGSLVTHAMLKDSEGAPIAITKTALDVIIIYATVYFTFSLPGGVALNNFNNNALLAYLLGTGALTSSVAVVGSCVAPDISVKTFTTATFGYEVGSTIYSSISGDTATRKLIFSTVRAAVDNFNHNLKELSFKSFFSFFIPNEQYAGTQYNDVPLGIGDGTNTLFTLPSFSISSESVVIKVAGNIVVPILNEKLISSALPTYHSSGRWYLRHVGHSACIVDGKTLQILIVDTYSTGTWSTSGLIIKSNGDNVYTYYSFPYPLIGYAVTDWLSYSGIILRWEANNKLYSKQVYSDGTLSDYVLLSLDAVYFTSITRACITDDKELLLLAGTSGTVLDGHSAWLVVCKLNIDTGKYEQQQIIYAHATSYSINFNCSPKGTYVSYISGIDSSLHILERIGSIYIEMSFTQPSDYAFSSDTFTSLYYYTPANGSGTDMFFSLDETLFIITTRVSSGSAPCKFFAFKLNTASNIWEVKPVPNVPPRTTAFQPIISPDSRLLASNTDKRVWAIDDMGNFTYMPVILNTSTNDTLFSPTVLVTGSGVLMPYGERGHMVSVLSIKGVDILLPTAPAVGEAVTASYFVEGIHKTNQYVIDIGAEIQFGEITE